MSADRLTAKGLGFLLALSLLTAFLFQGTRGVWEPDEGFYAAAAAQMARSGDYLVPRVNGGVFLEKPPVAYWGMVAGLKTLGWNEWGLRAFHAVCFALTAVLLALLGASFWGGDNGLRAGYAYLLTLAPFGASNVLTPDTPLTFFVTAAFLFFWEGWRRGEKGGVWKASCVLAFAVGFMTKGTAVLVWGTAPAAFLALSGGWRRYFKGAWVWIIPPAAAAALAWYAAVGSVVPGALEYFWKDQVTGRMVTGYYERNPGWGNVGYYLPVLLVGGLPFSFYWWGWGRDLWARWKAEPLRRWRENPVRLFLACWILPPMAVLTLAQSRLLLYALPVFGVFALAAARLGGDAWRSARAKWGACLWLALLLGVKLYIAGMPSNDDDRFFWRELKSRLPAGNGAVVLTTGNFNGIGFYADIPLRRAQWWVKYLYFDPPPSLRKVALSLKREKDWALFVTDYNWVIGVTDELKKFGKVAGPRPLSGRRTYMVLYYKPAPTPVIPLKP